ncbi:MAG: hypothetical protein ACM3WP_25675 [Acidobacteriota bacterium]
MPVHNFKPIVLILVVTVCTFAALHGLMAAPQLDPSLTPQKGPKPTLPKIDEKACGFEGCQFGPWTATDQVQLFSTWKTDRQPLATISKGQAVTAITGVHVTFEPSEIKVTAHMTGYGLKPGDTIYGYMYKGEGVFSAWFNGYWGGDFDGSGVADAGCNGKCSAKLLKKGRTEWWVEIKTNKGAIGWT